MTRSRSAEKGLLPVNGTRLHHEVRGNGPSLLFISGALGDAAYWEKARDLLVQDFTVISYDRRGNSRSPAPAGWKTTSMNEQADDAVGLLEALGLAPAAVYGNSGGGAIALNLVLRHPDLVRGVILHEPWLSSLLDDPEAAGAEFRELVTKAAMAEGMRAGVEAFFRFVAGDANYDAIPSELRERILGNGETSFLIESPMYSEFHPDKEALAAITRPVKVLVGIDGAPIFAEMANRLAKSLRTEVVRIPGAHVPQIDHAEEMVREIRGFFSSRRSVR